MRKNQSQYHKTYYLVVLFLCLLSYDISGQLSGTVTDASGMPIPYANVLIAGTTTGTVTNIEGAFTLDETRPKDIEVSILGYKAVSIRLTPNIPQAIVLKEATYDLDEIVVSANREDPAYPIIRKAIAKRPQYRKAIDRYKASLYIKGIIKLESTPDRVMGFEIGNLGGIVDSTGQGVVYQSESLSDIYYQYPDKIKEVMIHSKVAESDNSFSGNSIRDAFYNIYDERFDFFKTIVNPLADRAFSFYKYRLIGTVLREDGALVNKIEVIPKSKEKPLFSGFLYIISDSWKVEHLDFTLDGKTLDVDFFKEYKFQQEYIDSEEGHPLVFSQVINLKGGIFGFQVGGQFNYIFSDYIIDEDLVDDISFTEVFSIDEKANETSLEAWDEIRPVPLTTAESIEYKRKDSLKRVWKSKEFLDSIDHKRNKFELGNLLFGYTNQNSFKNTTWSVNAPWQSYRFNAVEGSSLGMKLSRTKTDSLELGSNSWSLEGRYGFADKKWKGRIAFQHVPNGNKIAKFNAYIEDNYNQVFNYRDLAAQPLTITYNTLIWNRNDIKFFRNRGLGFDFMKEVVNGLRVYLEVDYGKRFVLQNALDQSPLFKKKEFTSNELPIVRENDPGDHISLRTNIGIRYAPFQKYENYVHYKRLIPSAWPYLYVNFIKGHPILGAETDFSFLSVRLSDDHVDSGLLGHGKYYIFVGKFLSDNNLSFIDAQHFVSGAFLPSGIYNYRHGFMNIPHYDYSSFERFGLVAYEHHFDGYISNLIPKFRDLQWNFVLGASFLKSDDFDPYYEAGIGLENIGFKNLRFLRIDYALSFTQKELLRKRFVLRLRFNL